jgi:L-gulono-1,4-lactone dehydrogenase
MPTSEAELQAIVASAAKRGRRVKVVGAGHSFTPIAMTDGTLISLDRLNRLLSVEEDHTATDASDRTKAVTVQAGIRLKDLNPLLLARGLAMPNMGDIVEQSIAGAISTGTHGTGYNLGNIASQLVSLRIITASGEALDIDARNPSLFAAAKVSLGALGIISQVTLRCVPAFRLHAIEEVRKLDDVMANLDELFTTNDHAEFYWMPRTRSAFVKVNNRTDETLRPLSKVVHVRDKFLGENVGFGLVCRVGRRWPQAVPKLSKIVTSAPSRLDYIDDSYRVFASTRLVRFAEMEYAVPFERLGDAVAAVRTVVREIDDPILFPIEVRASAGDDALLSPAQGRRSGFVAVHNYKGMAYERYFRSVETALMEMGGRPHWGKVHFRSADTIRPAYDGFDEFTATRARLDPTAMFTNPYLDRVLDPVSAANSFEEAESVLAAR